MDGDVIRLVVKIYTGIAIAGGLFLLAMGFALGICF